MIQNENVNMIYHKYKYNISIYVPVEARGTCPVTLSSPAGLAGS